MNIVYNILHYMAFQETIECVESILKATSHSSHMSTIVITDNGSPNHSYEILVDKFRQESKVIILKAEENLGFARGNNIGFLYAKRELGADFIVQMNNDTLLRQADFNEILVEKYQRNQYAILGPDILSADNKHQNPCKTLNWKKKDVKRFLLKKRLQVIMTYFPLVDNYLQINAGAYLDESIKEDVLDTQLHGACLIFSPQYIQRFDGMCDQTFLYMEEDILRMQAIHFQLLMMYTPDLVIYHKEDAATDMAYQSSRKKKRAVYQNLYRSAKIYERLMRQYEENN